MRTTGALTGGEKSPVTRECHAGILWEPGAARPPAPEGDVGGAGVGVDPLGCLGVGRRAHSIGLESWRAPTRRSMASCGPATPAPTPARPGGNSLLAGGAPDLSAGR